MFNKTVDGVLRTLTKAVADLKVVAEQHSVVSLAKELEAQALLNEAEIAGDESLRAQRVAARLSELLA